MIDDTNDQPPVMGYTDEDAQTAIYRAIGAASCCWEDLRAAGVFDYTRAHHIAEELLEHLHRIYAIPRGWPGEEPTS